jgi:hypothetical protein
MAGALLALVVFYVSSIDFKNSGELARIYALSSLYVCMAIKHIIVLFVETPRKFITAKLSFRKPGSSSIPAYGSKALQ